MFCGLIIESDALLRKRIKEILSLRVPPLFLLEADAEKEALLQIKLHHPAFIILEIHLSGKNGLILAQQIKADFPHMTIIINSNNDTHEYRQAAAQSGVDYFFSKKNNKIDDIVKLLNAMYSSYDNC